MTSQSTLPSIEKLEGSKNYSNWKFAMQMYLMHEDLWDCIDIDETGNVKNKDSKKEQKAHAKLGLMVHPCTFVYIKNAKTAREVWENLKQAFEDKGLSRRLMLLRLLFGLKLNSFNTMHEYVSQVLSISQQLNDIDAGLSDEFVAVILLCGLPAEYNPMVMALEYSNVNLTTDLVKSKLLQENMVKELENKNETALFTKNTTNVENNSTSTAESKILDLMEIKVEPVKPEPGSYEFESNNLNQELKLSEEIIIIECDDEHILESSLNKILSKQNGSEIRLEGSKVIDGVEKMDEIVDVKWEIKNDELIIKEEENIEDEEHGRQYHCPIDKCPKRFLLKLPLERHMVEAHGHRFSCEFCNKSYSSSQTLTRHNCPKNSKAKVYCNVCSRSVLHWSTHRRTEQHGLLLKKATESTPDFEDVPEFDDPMLRDTMPLANRLKYKHVCQVCTKCFIHKRNMLKHMSKKHINHEMMSRGEGDTNSPGLPEIPRDSHKVTSCPSCHKLFSVFSVTQHRKTCNKYECYKCKLKFSIKRKFKIHVRQCTV